MDAQTLIKSAMRTARILRRGFTPSADDMNDALEALNMIIGSLSAQTTVPSRTIESLTPTSSATSFTIGSGGDFNTTRPIRIEEMYLQDANSNDYYVRPMDQAEYNRITVKNISVRPSRYWYTAEYSLGKIYFDSTLDTSYTVNITSVKPLTQLSALTTTIGVPDEYLLYFKYTLAMDLAQESGKELSQTILGRASEAKRVIRAITAANNVPEMTVEPGANGGRYNIYGDD